MPILPSSNDLISRYGEPLSPSDRDYLTDRTYVERRRCFDEWGWSPSPAFYRGDGQQYTYSDYVWALNAPDTDTPLLDFFEDTPEAFRNCAASHNTVAENVACVNLYATILGRFYPRLLDAALRGEMSLVRDQDEDGTEHSDIPPPPVPRCGSCTCRCEQPGGCCCNLQECPDCECIRVRCPRCNNYCTGCLCASQRCPGCETYSGSCENCGCRCPTCRCDNGRWCDRCRHGRRPRQLIYGYSERPTNHLEFLVAKDEKRELIKTYFGVELEVNYKDDYRESEYARQVLDKLGEDFVMLKYDGSLDRGFEIVTAPATLKVHRERWLPFFKDKPVGITSWNSGQCGMHVHISRPSPYIVGKMLVFLNNSAHQDKIEAIAGRSNTHWAAFRAKTMKDIRKDGYQHNAARYEALNTTNPNTVEVRIFRGTVRPKRFIRNLEFVVSMFNFCKDTSLDFDAAGRSRKAYTMWDEFMRYVADTRHEYPMLHMWLKGDLDLKHDKLGWWTVGERAKQAFLSARTEAMVDVRKNQPKKIKKSA